MPLIQLIEIQCHGILCIQAVFVKHKFIADNFLPLLVSKGKTHGVLAFCGNHAVDIAGNAVLVCGAGRTVTVQCNLPVPRGFTIAIGKS